MHKLTTGVALVIAVIACAVAIYAVARPLPATPAATAPATVVAPATDEAAVEERVYRRIVADVWQELMPIYRDFGIAIDGEPKTIGELLRPLMSVGHEPPAQP